jgi:hypothetical protein
VTPVDHRRPSARRQQKSPSRQSQHSQYGRTHARKPQRSHSAVGAAIVAAAAMVAVFAFILTRGGSPPTTDESLRSGAVADDGAAAAAPSAPTQSADPSPSVNTAKADRKPPASSTAPKVKTSATPNTGPTSPAFKRGQWIVVIDKYPTDVGMEADQLAKATAIKLITAGVPAKAMLVDGQYPGIANSSLEPVTNTWVVYLGPGTSSVQMLDLCSAPKTQAAFSNPCPTYEPAGAPAS